MQNKIIIFDIDGTLTNTNDVDGLFFERAILDILPFSSIDTGWHNYKYSTDTGILNEIVQRKLGRNPTSNEIEAIRNRFCSYLENVFLGNQPHCFTINGSQIIFEKIFQIGWDVAIATGGWEKSALLKLKISNISHQTIPIAHGDDNIERENIISIAIDRAQLRYKKLYYSKIIYIGDRMWDKVAAKNLKINFIGIGDTLATIENKDFFHISDFTGNNLLEYLINF